MRQVSLTKNVCFSSVNCCMNNPWEYLGKFPVTFTRWTHSKSHKVHVPSHVFVVGQWPFLHSMIAYIIFGYIGHRQLRQGESQRSVIQFYHLLGLPTSYTLNIEHLRNPQILCLTSPIIHTELCAGTADICDCTIIWDYIVLYKNSYKDSWNPLTQKYRQEYRYTPEIPDFLYRPV